MKNRRGLTLIEVTFAMVLLAVSVNAFLSGLGAVSRVVRRTRFEGQACGLAREILSRLEVTEYAGLVSSRGRFEPPFADWTFEVQLSSTKLPNLRNIRILIRGPPGAGGDGEFAAETTLANRRVQAKSPDSMRPPK